jgi:hypothetical protein
LLGRKESQAFDDEVCQADTLAKNIVYSFSELGLEREFPEVFLGEKTVEPNMGHCLN